MMRAYISVSFSKRESLDKELAAITGTLKEFDIAAFVFVDHYRYELSDERQMMEQAMNDIDNCDLLIAETSEKGIGIGVEAGYAKAKNKPVIYLRQTDAEHSTTVSGISDFQVIYTDSRDLEKQLTEVIRKLLPNEANGR